MAGQIQAEALGQAWLAFGLTVYSEPQARYGKVNEHNAWVPRDQWLDDWEKAAILDFETKYPLEGYRPLWQFYKAVSARQRRVHVPIQLGPPGAIAPAFAPSS